MSFFLRSSLKQLINNNNSYLLILNAICHFGFFINFIKSVHIRTTIPISWQASRQTDILLATDTSLAPYLYHCCHTDYIYACTNILKIYKFSRHTHWMDILTNGQVLLNTYEQYILENGLTAVKDKNIEYLMRIIFLELNIFHGKLKNRFSTLKNGQ